MTAPELLKWAEAILNSDLSLMAAKNHDYAGDEDCLDNLRDFGFFGIVVRLGDKHKRLKNFAKRRAAGNAELKVKNESIRDTLQDMRIYATLAEIVLAEEEGVEKGPGK